MESQACTSRVEFDRALIEKYDGHGPRYTSYPTADRFGPISAAEGADLLARAALELASRAGRPASLYIHVPFCDTVCFYCGCNKVATKDRSRAAIYIEYLRKEIELQAAILPQKPRVSQIHFGGGTPTFLSDAQITEVMNILRTHFDLQDDGEFSIELDPRELTAARVQHLAHEGFNRMSVGVQDLDPIVQKAVNRVQSEDITRMVIDAGRQAGFSSVSIDLIYGLPHQTVASVTRTLQRVLTLRPDRIALYNYAHLPERFMPQRRIDGAALPPAAAKLDILDAAIHLLTNAGYVYIGMDHFALPEDDLARAQQNGTLQRNFQGYSTYADCDLFAFGVSAIGKPAQGFVQNEKSLEAYYAKLDAGVLPIVRGYTLTYDDQVRRDAIQQLMCQFSLDVNAFEQKWQIDFADYFAAELMALLPLAEDGLLNISALPLPKGSLQVSAKGRMLIRSIAMVFDRHLQLGRSQARYSRLV
ncbi:oxygen-independent coproporphyrinogen III oxidase [Amantichitinum ursilacus]|uniref:Coproporphyrinogen-III oxidase n=1 Tax=Amantichitinum ursilacus TaxID=857265 RepID=A0A0N1JTV6_9NEIS|nr:oxygen-independent coproporphyrinogen III oxidase [Amantichitinum ursilacus]KPC55442.1 Oxygen-independent coproporphyrinogen-III oxidase [Amantichitinum ursilacus]